MSIPSPEGTPKGANKSRLASSANPGPVGKRAWKIADSYRRDFLMLRVGVGFVRVCVCVCCMLCVCLFSFWRFGSREIIVGKRCLVSGNDSVSVLSAV